MKYTETPTSKLLKQTNELIHKKVGSLLSTKSKNVRESITKEIELLY